MEAIGVLIKTMTKVNRTWGAERIWGELLNVGFKVAKNTIQKNIYQVCSPLTSETTTGSMRHSVELLKEPI